MESLHKLQPNQQSTIIIQYSVIEYVLKSMKPKQNFHFWRIDSPVKEKRGEDESEIVDYISRESENGSLAKEGDEGSENGAREEGNGEGKEG